MPERKRWEVGHDRADHTSEIEEISSALHISSLTAALLYGRGFKTSERARAFLERDDECFYDPFLLPDMDKAVRRVIDAINRREKIYIYGDYDVDGVTAVSTLFLYLRSKGADVSYYIPERISEGYGVNCTAVDIISSRGCGLIITVDTGITAAEEARYAKTLGIDMVITDHHECSGKLPEACAVVNPHREDSHYPFPDIAGVGVAFKLVCALERTVAPKDDRYLHRMCSEYGDLVAVGTIADVMPLIGENRLIASIGLKLIEDDTRVGFTALRKVISDESQAAQKKKKVNSSYIGYTIAPRINAAGRLRSASTAVELFITQNPERAEEIASSLCEINRERQESENAITAEAFRMIDEEHDFIRDRVIVLSSEQWHHGIIGIVASRITDRYGLPSVMISFDGGRKSDGISEDDVGKGSGRSIRGMNLAQALTSCGDLLLKSGGHEMAAGLTLKRGNLEAFKASVNEYAADTLMPEQLIPVVSVDTEVTMGELTEETVSELSLLEPFGCGNPAPLLMLRNVKLAGISSIGSGKHTRLDITDGGAQASGVLFGRAPEALGVYAGDTVDIIFTPEINEFRGVRRVQLIVREIRECGSVLREREALNRRYSDFVAASGGAVSVAEIPTRADFRAVYLYIKNALGDSGTGKVDFYRLCGSASGNRGQAYIRLRAALAILIQKNVLSYSDVPDFSAEGGILPLTVNTLDSKADLFSSDIYINLTSRVKRQHN